MSEVIVFISHQKVKAGKLEEFRQMYQKVVAEIEADKPGTAAHLGYASQDGSQATFVHVFRDAGAMDRHMVGLNERIQQSAEFIQTEGYEIYGQPSQMVMERMRQFAGSEIRLIFQPDSLGGYIHLTPG